MNSAIARLFVVVALAFAGLAASLTYWQAVAARNVSNRAGNVVATLQESTIQRGPITASDGSPLAGIRKVNRNGGIATFPRTYPQAPLAAHAVGYSSLQESRSGIERAENDVLTGTGTNLAGLLDDVRGRTRRGGGVQLTIDPKIQRAAEQALAGRAGAVVAIEPATGAIRALVSAPTFDQDKIGTRGYTPPPSSLLDRAVNARYTPGSVFKLVTAAAALDSGAVSGPDQRFTDTGSFDDPVSRGQPVRNFGGEVFGSVDFTTALEKSINTVFATVGESLGDGVLVDYMRRFGFFARHPAGLPESEVSISGLFSDRNGRFLGANPTVNDPARLAIGQERLGVTPLQMAMVGAAIANGGQAMEPYLVQRTADADGRTIDDATPTRLGDPVMRRETAAILGAMMQRVVESGTGTAAQIPGVAVSGKSGTADQGEQNTTWFVAFAPTQNARLAVAVALERAQGTGGENNAPIAKQVLQAALAEPVGAATP